ncbi:hypothetical protein SUGI_0752250 [Cryptomeria japonica]|nr:hypothetical protein SUGI_0752250 [Cryptomeria japonica]
MAGSKYYAVRRGRCVGIYDNWNDCKRQVDGFSGCQYKSFSALKEAQDYVAQGTQDSQAVCGKQDAPAAADSYKNFSDVKPETFLQQDVQETQATNKKQGLYYLEFDGASKGNPGKSGAGAVLRNPDFSVACKIKEGVGLATNNVAEYRALIRGLKVCLSKGIDCIHVQGDSNLVVMQIQDKWNTRSDNIADLSKEAKELKSKFREFHIDHVLRVNCIGFIFTFYFPSLAVLQ